MKNTILGILALQIVFGLIIVGAIYMGQEADARCKPVSAPPLLKNCHHYPEAGPGAMACTWVPIDPQPFPWAPTRRCDSN
jgi:hypothetical protein